MGVWPYVSLKHLIKQEAVFSQDEIYRGVRNFKWEFDPEYVNGSNCKLELNQEKSKIVYCRSNQKRQPPFKVKYQKFDFLGYTFKPRIIKERGKIKLGFSPAMSQKSRSRIAKELQTMKIHRWVQFPIQKIAGLLKLKLRGWLNYYGKFRMSEMRKLFRVIHLRLTKWIRNKYRRFRKKPWYVGYKYLQKLSRAFPNLFEHWQYEGFRP